MPSIRPYDFLLYCYPETIWVGLLLVCLLIELTSWAKKWYLVVLVLGSLTNVGLLAHQYYALTSVPSMALLGFYPQYISYDYLIVLILLLVIGQIRLYAHLHNGVVYSTLCLLVLSLQLLNNTQQLLFIFTLLESIAIGSYVLIALDKQHKAVEASLKYLLFGATVAGIFLYGISLYYGITQSLILTSIPMSGDMWSQLVVVILVVAGLFKLVAVPLHSWSPDVYEGSPSPITFFLSTASKLAGVIYLHILLYPLPTHQLPWGVYWLLVLATLGSLSIGVLGALPQHNLKRLLAYSSIAHTGFLLMGFLANAPHLVTYYVWAYTLASAILFYLLSWKESKGLGTDLVDFAGWGLRHKVVGIVLVVAFMSLIGLPPTAGFTAKLFVLSKFVGVITSHPIAGICLLGVALVSTVVSLFFYLKVPYQLFFRTYLTKTLPPLHLLDYCYLGLCVVGLVGLFLGASWWVQ